MRGRRVAVAVVLGTVVLAVSAGGWFVIMRGGSVAPTVALDAPHFVEEATAAGLVHTYDGGTPFIVGGGVATFDCDEDGLPELYLAGGERPAALFHNESSTGGALRFAARPDPATDLTEVTGAYPIDIDGDGHTDLAVLRVGENVLLRGLGDCRFERANEAWSFDGGDARSMAFSATWEGPAALPTLAVGDYVAVDATGTPQLPCPDGALFRPAANGAGYGPAIPLSPAYCTLSMLFSDWDRSGHRDLRVSNDRQYYTDGEEQLWRMREGEVPSLYTDADGWVTMQIWGMGIASQDLTGDGYPEIFLTSQGDNKLQTLMTGPSQPTYRDIALKRGVLATQPIAGGESLPSTAWHPEFEDVNNDGFLDLFISKGNVSAQPDHASKDPSELLLGQPDGTFAQATEAAGLLAFARSRGAAIADLDVDGLVDLVEMRYGEPVALWRNAGAGDGSSPAPPGGWVALRLRQSGPNRDAIGAWVEIKLGDTVTPREMTIGGGHISGQLGAMHVGLGTSPSADVRVTWPDGVVGPWQRVAAGGVYEIERGVAEPRPWIATAD